MAIGILAHRPKVSRAVGAALGYWPLVIDLPGIAYFQAHLRPGGIPLCSLFDLLRPAVVVPVFLFVVSWFFGHDLYFHAGFLVAPEKTSLVSWGIWPKACQAYARLSTMSS